MKKVRDVSASLWTFFGVHQELGFSGFLSISKAWKRAAILRFWRFIMLLWLKCRGSNPQKMKWLNSQSPSWLVAYSSRRCFCKTMKYHFFANHRHPFHHGQVVDIHQQALRHCGDGRAALSMRCCIEVFHVEKWSQESYERPFQLVFFGCHGDFLKTRPRIFESWIQSFWNNGPIDYSEKQICEILRAEKNHGTFRRTHIVGVNRMILLVCLQLFFLWEVVL